MHLRDALTLLTVICIRSSGPVLFLPPLRIGTGAVVVPENGATLEFGAGNRFISVPLTHALGGPSDVNFSVTPPRDHGVVVVVHSMRLRRGVPVIGPSQCYEYVKFNTTDSRTGKEHSAFACGSISEDSFELIGHRSFVGGVNDSVRIEVHFSNDFGGQRSNDQNDATNSTFVLDITAYSDCRVTNSANHEQEFACSPTVCIPWSLHCDSSYSCPTASTRLSLDELNCQLQKRESPSSTVKPLFNADISSSLWPWNWGSSGGQKVTTTTTTTEKPFLVFHYFENGRDTSDDTYLSWWSSQMPLITVILIFLAISCLLFGMCSFMAKWNTRRHAASEATCHPRRQELGVPNPYSIPAPEGRVYFYPECDNRAYLHTPPPPAYGEDHSSEREAPPSYNTLFRKNPSSAYASEGVGTPPVAHTISGPPVYDTTSLNSPK